MCSSDLLAQLLRIRGLGSGVANLVDEGERWPGEDAEGRTHCGGVGGVVDVAAGQGVGDRVEAAGAVLDGEVEAEELADPLMLRHGGESLIKQELQAVVVRAHTERPAPQIRPPLAHRLDQPDQLAAYCGGARRKGG